MQEDARRMNPAILSRATAYSGYLHIEKLQIQLADGVTVSREIESHGDAAAVLPYDSGRRCALIARLFRAPVFCVTQQDYLDEACAGMIEQEDDATTARREAQEELGVVLNTVERVARVWSSPGISTERQSLFLASYEAADRVGPGGGAAGENEDITVIERSLVQLIGDLDGGRIADAKLVILLLALRYKRPELFQ